MKKSKLILGSLLASTFALGLTSCGGRQTLLFLNWGEYIDEDILDAFEEKYNCNVSMDLGDSNEIFYSMVRSGTTVYDVVCPSDYMVEKMYSAGLLQKIDFSKLTMSGYNPNTPEGRDSMRLGVLSILDDMNTNLKANNPDYVDNTILNYFVPYLWGTWGIMYSTSREDFPEEYKDYVPGEKSIREAVTNGETEWSALFDRSSLPESTRVSMYDSYQHVYYAASRYLENTNPVSNAYGIELPKSDLDTIKNLISDMKYNSWGTDNIKKDINGKNSDIGYMWTGDFLYYYCEEAAKAAIKAYINGDVTMDNMVSRINEICDSSDRVYENNGNKYGIRFDFFNPEDTVAFCDNLVITKDPSNVDLAHKFIDFMSAYQTSASLDVNGEEIEPSTLEEDEILTPCFNNTYYVCYDAWNKTVYDDLVALADDSIFNEEAAEVFEEQISEMPAEETDLYGLLYDYVTGIAYNKYYQKDSTKGEILATFTQDYIGQIYTAFNNART
jgi:spermidine/putrescine-binding protein